MSELLVERGGSLSTAIRSIGLEEKLDDGLAEMLGDLQRLSQANMAGEIDRFVAALERDLVLPEDFLVSGDRSKAGA